MTARSSIWIAALLLSLTAAWPARAQDDTQNAGQKALDRAIEAKLTAENFRELGQVIELCQQALDKGLDDSNTEFAEQLLASTLFQRAEVLSQAIFGAPRPDPRWGQMRQFAIADLERSIELIEEHATAHLLLARLYALPGGDRERARKAVDKALELDNDDPSTRVEALLLRAGLRENAEERLADLNEAVKLAPEDPKPLRVRGTVFLAQNKGAEALADFEAALELEPDHAGTHEAKGLALGMLERWDEARESYSRAAELAPESPTAYIQLGRINALSGDPEAAVADINKALEIDPDNLAALLFRAQAYQQSGKLAEALGDINRVLELRPGLSPALRARAILLASSGKLDAAIADLEQLRQQEPKDATAPLQLGMLYATERYHAKAIDAYTAALEIDPKNWIAYRGRADATLSIGKQREAIADYEQALEIEPENSGVLNNLAWVLATSPDDSLRNGQRAIELATKASELTEHKQAHILSTLAAAYAETGDFDKAIDWSQKAVEAAADSDDEKMKKNLAKELASYQERKPWRELQNEPPAPPEDAEDSESQVDEETEPQDEADDDRGSDKVEDPEADEQEADGEEQPENESGPGDEAARRSS